MFDEIIKSIKAELYDRSVSPLMGTFIISWLLWNYKFVLLIFSGVALLDKYKIIDDVLYTPWVIENIWWIGTIKIHAWLFQGIILPLVTSAAYIYLYPLIAIPVFKYARKRQKDLITIKKQIEDETPIDQKEARELRNKIFELQIEMDDRLSFKDNQIKQLKNQIQEEKNALIISKKQDNSEDSEEEKNRNRLPEELEKILKIISTELEFSYEEDIFRIYEGTRIQANYAIGELINRDYISSNRKGGDKIYALTHKGRAYIVENKLFI